MPKHTPGRWSRNIKPAKKYNTIFAGGNTHVCHLAVTGLTDEEIEGNCNLIMSAPELLAALKALLAYDDDPPAAGTFGAEVYQTAHTAIARAEGEPVFYCRGCNREESLCSADPCAGVLADRQSARAGGDARSAARAVIDRQGAGYLQLL